MLDAVLGYCSSKRAPRFSLDHPLAWQLIRAFDEYDVSQTPLS